MSEKWDRRFLELAQFISRWSYDPSTKTGAVIVDSDRTVISVGYNGFARGVGDYTDRYENREIKYKLVAHCERNAILFADRDRLKGATLYTVPFMSCSVCAGLVIQSGIKRCVAPPLPKHLEERWGDDIGYSKLQFKEAGVELNFLELEDPRKTALKNGLRQLNVEQLLKVMEKREHLLLDDRNYKDGKFCPLAVGVGLTTMQSPSDQRVFELLKKFGFKVFNTRGVEGEFYTTDRKRDLVVAVEEVIQEKLSVYGR